MILKFLKATFVKSFSVHIPFRKANVVFIKRSMTTAATQVHVDVFTSSPLIDSPVEVKVNGLEKSKEYTVALGVKEGKSILVSSAHFLSNERGIIDLTKDASLSGSYTGVNGMALFWTLRPATEHTIGMRLIKKDVLEPMTFQLAVFQGHVKPRSFSELLPSGKALITTEINRWYHDSSSVDRIPIRHGRIRATLFAPKNTGPCPGILEMFGSGGGLMEFRAALLAHKGFTVLATAYFGYEDLPRDLDVDLEYFDEAIKFLVSHPAVLPGGIGTLGNSKGGEIVLDLAAYNPHVKATVAACGVHFYSYGILRRNGEETPKILPDVPKFQFDDKNHLTMLPGYYPDTDVDEKYHLPVEKIPDDSQVLFVQAEEDLGIGYHHYPVLCEKMKRAGKTNFRFLSYPHAGHLLEPPHAPSQDVVYHGVFSVIMKYGGDPYLHGAAQVKFWDDIVNFYRDNLPKQTQNSHLDMTSKL